MEFLKISFHIFSNRLRCPEAAGSQGLGCGVQLCTCKKVSTKILSNLNTTTSPGSHGPPVFLNHLELCLHHYCLSLNKMLDKKFKCKKHRIYKKHCVFNYFNNFNFFFHCIFPFISCIVVLFQTMF